MKGNGSLLVSFLALFASIVVAANQKDSRPISAEHTAGKPPPLYHPDPEHLWNRVHRALFVSTGGDGTEYGFDSSIFVGGEASMLVQGRRQTAFSLLDELASDKGADLIREPIKRAVLQHDLWTIFDAFTSPHTSPRNDEQELKELRVRLARCIRKLSLTSEEIKALPDNYALAVKSHAFGTGYDSENADRPFLPADLFDPKSSWVQIEPSQNDEVIGPVHTEAISGRSVFEVFIRLPGGRDDTLAYLQKLNLFQTPWKLEPASIATRSSDGEKVRWDPWQLNPDTPQFPPGTAVALVRRMIAINSNMELMATPIVQGVQLRVYREISETTAPDAHQNFYEFVWRRAKLFAQKEGGFHAIEKDEKEPQLLFHTIGETEQQRLIGYVVLKTCTGCHNQPGIFSVNSYTHLLTRPNPNPQLLPANDPNDVCRMTTDWKKRQFNWGVLRGLVDVQTK